MAFLIIGFVLVAYFELPILAVALIGLAVALYDYYINNSKGKSSGRRGGLILMESSYSYKDPSTDNVITKKKS